MPDAARSCSTARGHRPVRAMPDAAARKMLASAIWEDFAALGWQRVEYRRSRRAVELGLGDLIPGVLCLTEDEMSLVGARGLAPPIATSALT